VECSREPWPAGESILQRNWRWSIRLHLQSVTVRMGWSMDKSPLPELVPLKSLRCSNDRDRANCLTAAQIAVVDKLYGGPVDREGRPLPRQSNDWITCNRLPTVHAAWNVSLSGEPVRAAWIGSPRAWPGLNKVNYLPTSLHPKRLLIQQAVVLTIQPREQETMQNCQNKTDISLPNAKLEPQGKRWRCRKLCGSNAKASDDRVNWIGNDLFQPNDSRLEMSYSVERLIFTWDDSEHLFGNEDDSPALFTIMVTVLLNLAKRR